MTEKGSDRGVQLCDRILLNPVYLKCGSLFASPQKLVTLAETIAKVQTLQAAVG